ncbi:MAG TPA: hypothetical protein VHL53_02165 [Acidimicrobiia bacterium]|nr:hypothetical protein [Acidimicrobiia bacterium]
MRNLIRRVANQWDRAAAAVLVVVGLIALLLGWLGVSDARLTTQQLPYLVSGGMFALFALGLAGALWISADLRDEWLELRRLSRRLDPGSEPVLVDEFRSPVTGRSSAPSGEVASSPAAAKRG